MGVARERNRLGLLLRTGTWWASFEANPQAQQLVFKSSLVLSGRAAKDNFTTEPRSPSRLLGKIEPICNRGEGFDEVVLQNRGQTIAHFWGGTAMPTDSESLGLVLNLRLIAGVVGFDVDATASGRLLWLERGGRRLKPIRKTGGLSSNRALS
ncbi:hypothetical protein ACFQHW_09260 [Lapidilactobacillus achengensis]|uniref:Uncharacterized protein n=1 Tax=Lapidilactobacillus achengensis TaxID=2486000 RepID=A0ABW1USF7_9LACO|nr:hypothetical protein [Lapidilactobacillus achengensis]